MYGSGYHIIRSIAGPSRMLGIVLGVFILFLTSGLPLLTSPNDSQVVMELTEEFSGEENPETEEGADEGWYPKWWAEGGESGDHEAMLCVPFRSLLAAHWELPTPAIHTPPPERIG